MRRFRPTGFGFALVACLCLSPTFADVFYLTSGGEIEGQFRGETETHYQVRTFVGQVELAKSDVVKHESGPSIFDAYDRQLALLNNTADELVALADWCGDNGLSKERREHLNQALQLDPDHAAARAALGYTRVGNLWVESETVIETEAQRTAAANQAQREAEREQRRTRSKLHFELKDIERKYFSGVARERAQGGIELLAFSVRDPLALPAMFDYLKGQRSLLMRDRIVKVFTHSTDPQTTLYIVYAALKDPSQKIRQYAIKELFRRDPQDVVPILAAAVDLNSNAIKTRAADLLTKFNDPSAIPALIDNLVSQQMASIEYVDRTSYSKQIRWRSKSATIADIPRDYPEYFETKRRRAEVSVYHHPVRDALRRLTGVDFGFDQNAWRRWHQKNQATL